VSFGWSESNLSVFPPEGSLKGVMFLYGAVFLVNAAKFEYSSSIAIILAGGVL
jgi:hypothetical protein